MPAKDGHFKESVNDTCTDSNALTLQEVIMCLLRTDNS